jgi:hypothetical protein
MSVDINKNSLLRTFTLSSIDGIELWTADDLPDLPSDTTDDVKPYTEYDMVDSLAYQNYRDEVVWWGVSLVNQFWDSLRALEGFAVEWVDLKGFQNKWIVFGDEMADQIITSLENHGIDRNNITKTRIFDTVRIASAKRVFGLL